MSEPAPQTISLNEIGHRYLSALQHLSDLMVVTWAGAQSLDADIYEKTFRSIPGLPSTSVRFPFETARTEAALWWVKNSLNEVLGLSQVFLEDIRRVCGMVVFSTAKAKASGDLAALAAEVNSAPGALDITSRIKHLQSRYGVVVPLEAEIVSLTGLHRCLFQTGGSLPEGAALALQLKAIQPPAEGSSEPRFADYSHTWKSGERVSLSREEHAAIFTSISLFLSTTLASAQEFAKASGLAENPPLS